MLALLIAAQSLAAVPASAVSSTAVISKAFGTSTVSLGDSTSLTFAIQNTSSSSGVTGVSFTDTLPAGLVVSTPSGENGDCGIGSTVTATAGSSSVSLANGTLGPNEVCAISLNVTGTSLGQKVNSVTVSSSGATGNTSQATVTVVNRQPPDTTMSFSKQWVRPGETANLDIFLENPNEAIALTGVGFTNTLPAGLTVASPSNLAVDCGSATVTAPAGGQVIAVSGATLASNPGYPGTTNPGAYCSLTVDVAAATNGFKTDSTGPIHSNEAGDGAAKTASLSVIGPGPQVYWTNPDLGTPDGAVLFAKLDGSVGSEVRTYNAHTRSPVGVALDPAAGRVYWLNSAYFGGSGRDLSFASFDGSSSGTVSIAGAPTPFQESSLTLDAAGGRAYWTTDGIVAFANLDSSGGGHLNLGSATPPPALNNAPGLALDRAQGRIYWISAGSKISYAKLNNSGGGDIPITGVTTGKPAGAAIDPVSGRIYWAEEAANKIDYANLDGSGGGTLATGSATLANPVGVAIDPLARRIYWASAGGNTLSYANLDGSGGGDLPTPGAPANNAEFLSLLHQPTAGRAPQVTGGAAPGASLKCSKGSWGADDPGAGFYRAPHSYTYAWLRDGHAISGATGSSYRAAKAGAYVCRVTATNEAGGTTKASDPHPVFPNTKITRMRLNRARAKVKFSFKAKGGAARFQCALVKVKRHRHVTAHFSGCTSPQRYTGLQSRKYRFEVRAIADVGADPTPATKRFKG